MRIDHLELINFKRFEHLKADFRPGVNLLVGTNGAGKTAILEGLAVALGAFFSNRLPGPHQRTIDQSENRLVNGLSTGLTEVIATSSIVGKWARAYNPETKTNDTKNIKAAVSFATPLFEAFKVADDQTIAPLISYQSTERLHGLTNRDRKSAVKPEYHEGRRLGYWRALDERSLKKTIVQWLIDCIVDRSIYTDAGAPFKDERALQTVLDGVKSLLEYFNIIDNSKHIQEELTIFPTSKFPGELMVKIDSQMLPLSYYSDGFRALIYLVMDLVWRAAVLNPWLSLVDLKSQLSGVVLIDEIDLHLHPKWQAKAISFLQSLFPGVQFFISTHSTTVIANFKPRSSSDNLKMDGVFVIDDHSLNELKPLQSDFYGQDVNSIIENLQDALPRAKEIEEKMDRFDAIVRKSDITDEEAKEAIKIVADLSNDVPSTDVRFVTMLSRAERIKKTMA